MKHHDIVRFDMKKPLRFGDGTSGFIHHRFRLEQDDPNAVDPAIRNQSLELSAPGGEAMLRRDMLDGHVADIVSMPLVLPAGISESCKKYHLFGLADLLLVWK